MGAKSTLDRYGSVAIAIHWITAALILAQIVLGLNAEDADTDALKRTLLVSHIAIGLTVLLLTLFRILWWWRADNRPPLPATTPALLAMAARASHFLIYGFIIALAVTGVATNLVGGVMDALMSGEPIPPLEDLGPRMAHGLLAWSFMALLAIHIAAALYHHFVRRDGLLARMGIGKS